MQFPFDTLRPEYEALLASMQITRGPEVDHVAHKLLGFVNEGRYTAVSLQTGVPIAWMATSFEREASSDFRLSAAQGDPWNHVSTHVPRGRGPFNSWDEAAIDAYHIDGLDKVGTAGWTEARACYEGEIFNGMGYRAHGIHSPYLWAGSNHYVAGKYVADGVWDAHAVDQQLGIVPVWRRMIELQPALAFGNAPPPMPVPIGLGTHETHDAFWLQAALNQAASIEPAFKAEIEKLGGPDRLVVDGSVGHETMLVVRAFETVAGLTVDRGFAGPQVFGKLDEILGADWKPPA